MTKKINTAAAQSWPESNWRTIRSLI